VAVVVAASSRRERHVVGSSEEGSATTTTRRSRSVSRLTRMHAKAKQWFLVLDVDELGCHGSGSWIGEKCEL
jgi:hypothetical protein